MKNFVDGKLTIVDTNKCIHCGKDLLKEGIFFGAGDGKGQKFQCAECFDDPKNYNFGNI